MLTLSLALLLFGTAHRTPLGQNTSDVESTTAPSLWECKFSDSYINTFGYFFFLDIHHISNYTINGESENILLTF